MIVVLNSMNATPNANAPNLTGSVVRVDELNGALRVVIDQTGDAPVSLGARLNDGGSGGDMDFWTQAPQATDDGYLGVLCEGLTNGNLYNCKGLMSDEVQGAP